MSSAALFMQRQAARTKCHIEVEKHVYVDAEVSADDFSVEQLRLMLAEKLGESEPDEPAGITAERAYYAMHRGDNETVHRFVAERAGRIW